MKKLLVIPHYFYPDIAATAQIVTELCEKLQYDFEITVICVVPSCNGNVQREYERKRLYFEQYQNISIVRVKVPNFSKQSKSSRIKNILLYFFNTIIAINRVGKQDIVFTMSQPPILGGVLGVIAKIIKKSKLVYNIQDFNPEQTEAIGYVKNKAIIYIARSIDKFSCKMADKIVVVGGDMEEVLKDRFKPKKAPKNVVINNWINKKEIFPLGKDNDGVINFKKKYGLENKFVFMYSGNIGLYYDLKNIVKIIGTLKNLKDVVFAFVGEGAIKQQLMNYCIKNNLDNVVFIPYQNRKDLNYSLNAADAHIVTNAKGLKGISVPSKIYGILAAGKFVLAVLENGSEARNIIEGCNCGKCIEPGDYVGLKNLLNDTYERKNELTCFGERGKKYSDENLEREVSIMKYRLLLYELLGSSYNLEEIKNGENYG